MKILVADKLSNEGLAALKARKGLEIVEAAGQPRAEILKKVAEAEGLVVRSETQVDKELLAAAKKLRVVGRAGVGVDNIDIAEATERGVVVMNAPEGNTIATCELAFAHLINAFRPLVNAAASMREGKWDKKNLVGVELYGKTLGVLGLGRIGAQVALRARAFGMKVIAFDPYLTADRAQALGVAKTDLETLLKTADAITLHLPLSAQTKNILNADAFAKMKKGVRVVNCARGELVDAEALLKAVETGQVAAAGLDVFAEEPLAEASALRKNAKIALTPHLGASTAEAQAGVGVEIAESVAGLLLDGQIRNAINAPSVSVAELERLRPFLVLGGRLAGLAQALGPQGISVLRLKVSGGVPEKDLLALSRAVMRGYLAKIASGVNEVNAPTILERMGVAFELQRTSVGGDYAEAMAIEAEANEAKTEATAAKVQAKTEIFSVAGALIGASRQPRLVAMREVNVELPLVGRVLLAIENNDVPGIVGHVGTVLAGAQVNIANMSLGRLSGAGVGVGTALTILELDSVPEERTLEGLKKNGNVLSARVVEM